MATPPSPNDLTRQQLDELDSLLQRMLALPLSKPEPADGGGHRLPHPPLPLPEPPAPRPVAGWRADVPAATAKAPYLAPEPEPDPAQALAPTFRAFAPPAAAPDPARPAEAFVARIHVPAPSPHSDEYAATGPGTLRGVDAPALPFGYPPREADPEPAADPAGWPRPADPAPPAFAGMTLDEVNPFADVAAQATPPESASTPAGPRVPVVLWPVLAANWVIEFALGWFGPLGHLLTRPWAKTVLGWAGVLLLAGAGAWAARGMGWLPWPR
jgi:hypothetical protein